jgi:hypothetical protein
MLDSEPGWRNTFQLITISSNFFTVSIVMLGVMTRISILLILSLQHQLGAEVHK